VEDRAVSEPRRVLRWAVPIDDAWHRIEYAGEICAVGSRNLHAVEFWTTETVEVRTLYDGEGRLLKRPSYVTLARENPLRAYEFRVFGTGHAITDGLFLGTAVAPGDRLVWHLFGREVP
jgi:hypothetical protein